MPELPVLRDLTWMVAAAAALVLVRVVEDEDAEWIRARGGRPVLYSAAAADHLLAWIETRTPA